MRLRAKNGLVKLWFTDSYPLFLAVFTSVVDSGSAVDTVRVLPKLASRTYELLIDLIDVWK
jgi:hypothetical protein